MTKPINCPVCDTELRKSDIPKHNIYVCNECDEIVQIHLDGTMVLMGDMLARGALGDDRVKAAISKPHITCLRSFTDVYSNVQHRLSMEMSEATGAARVVLAQAENRQDFAIAKLIGLDLAIPGMDEILSSLREVRELISPTPAGHKGIHEKIGSATS